MADEQKQVQVDTQEQAKETTQANPQESEASKELERLKAELAGVNRKNSELQKVLEAEKKAKMTEAEREKAEKAELEKLRAETLREKLTYKLGRTLVKKGLPEELTDLLLTPPQTEDELDDYTGKIESYFKAHSAKALEELRVSNTRTTPLTKGTGKVMNRAEFNKLDPTERSKFMLDGGSLKD